MTIFRSFLAISILLALCACEQEPSKNLSGLSEERGSRQLVDPDNSAAPVPLLSARDLMRVCKAAQAFGVGRDVTSIKGKKIDENMVRLSYTRDDGKPFQYDCRVEGEQVRTRMIDEAGPGTGPGQWSGSGSTTTFRIRDDGVYVTEVYFDGSSDEGLIDI